MPLPRLLQFNYESSVTYNDDGFTVLSVKGALEIPLTRDPNQQTRTFQQTADAFRGEVERRVMSGVDLTRFRMVRRTFSLSRDKRVLSWDFQAEEKPYMDMPAGCTVARGSYNVRPAKAGMGLATWLCTLRCTYTVRGGAARRIAWFAFLFLLRHRMSKSRNIIPAAPPQGNNQQRPPIPAFAGGRFGAAILEQLGGQRLADAYGRLFQDQNQQRVVDAPKNGWLMDFSYDEGMYLDSKTVSFSATWKLTCNFSTILLSSGIWSKVEGDNRDLWAVSMKDIQGAQSWVAAPMLPDVIVDFGGGDGAGPVFG